MTDEEQQELRDWLKESGIRRDTVQLLRCIEVYARNLRYAIEEERTSFVPELTGYCVRMIASEIERRLAFLQNFIDDPEGAE